jgi:hypothetical protein
MGQGLSCRKDFSRADMFFQLIDDGLGHREPLGGDEVLEIVATAIDTEAFVGGNELLHVDFCGELFRAGSLLENISHADRGAPGKGKQGGDEKKPKAGMQVTGQNQQGMNLLAKPSMSMKKAV